MSQAKQSSQLPRLTTLAVCCLAMMTISFGTQAPALCARSIEGDFHMGLDRLGVFLSASLWGLIVAILAVGPLADRYGFRWLFAASAIFQGVGLAIMSSAHSQWTLMGGSFIVGLGNGIVDALATPIVCAVYPERRVRISNILHAFYAVGLIFTVLLVTVLRQVDWPWRPILRVLAVLAIPYGLCVLATPLPRQSHVEGTVRMPIRQILFQPAYVLFLLAIAFGAMTEFGANSWLPRYVQAAQSGSELLGGLGLLLFGVLMVVGRLGTSAFVHRFGARRLFLFGGALCALSLVMAALPVGAMFSMIWLAVLGLGVAGFWPTIVGSAGDRFPRAGATMYSLLAAAGNFGAALGPVFIGYVASAQGLNVAMALLAVAPVLVVGLMLRLVNQRSAVSDQPSAETNR